MRDSTGSPDRARQAHAPLQLDPANAAGKPNIIFVLADDLSANLVPYTRHVQQLQRQATSFSRSTVADSLCCPSRASGTETRFAAFAA